MAVAPITATVVEPIMATVVEPIMATVVEMTMVVVDVVLEKPQTMQDTLVQ